MKAKIVGLIPYKANFQGQVFDKYYLITVSPSASVNVDLYCNLDKISATKAEGLKAGMEVELTYSESKDGKRYLKSIVRGE